MNWLRGSYDRLSALTGALFLLCCSFFIYLRAQSFNEQFTSGGNTAALARMNISNKSAEVVAAIEKLRAPQQLALRDTSKLFVPEKHYIDEHGQPATLHYTQLRPPVPNDWLEEYNLPIAEDDVLSQDPDQDGFSNLDEWRGHTHPTLKDSHPPYSSKLKLRSCTQEPFPLIFSSSMDNTYAINGIDHRTPTQFLRKGDMIAGTRYRVAGYEEKHQTDRNGTVIDVSELTLEHVDTHEHVSLVKERQGVSSQSAANFLYNWNGKEEKLTVKKDQEFVLSPAGTKYKLLEIEPRRAVIADIRKPGERIEIGPE